MAGAAGAICSPAIRRGPATERLLRAGIAAPRRKPRIHAGPLGRRPGFATAAADLVAELQAAMLDPSSVEAAASGLEDSAYLGELAAMFPAPMPTCATPPAFPTGT